MISKQQITVILPVYNEAISINETLDAVIDFSIRNEEFNFMFVDDGSKDSTRNIIEERIKNYPHIKLLLNPINGGKAFALRYGIKESNDELICFTDGDLAYMLDHLYSLVDALQKYDVVIGNRNLSENHLRNVKRFIAGEVFNRIVRLMLNLNITDTQAGLKGFRRDVAKHLFSLQKIDNFAFDAEVLYIAKLKGYTITQVPATVCEKHQFKPSTLKLFTDPPKMFWSLIKVIYNKKRGLYNG
jgi:dolichyl-phosphate beta-glucosyltransferase